MNEGVATGDDIPFEGDDDAPFVVRARALRALNREVEAVVGPGFEVGEARLAFFVALGYAKLTLTEDEVAANAREYVADWNRMEAEDARRRERQELRWTRMRARYGGREPGPRCHEGERARLGAGRRAHIVEKPGLWNTLVGDFVRPGDADAIAVLCGSIGFATPASPGLPACRSCERVDASRASPE